MEAVTSVRARIGTTPFLTQIEYGDKTFFSVEPGKDGGRNEGPSPPVLLASSLASCTAITLRMYVNRKQWNIEEISVNVVLTKENGINTFNCEVSCKGDVDDEKRKRLIHIASACPVHKILLQPNKILTTFK